MVLLVVAVCLLGCGGREGASGDEATAGTAATPQRIVTLAPNLTELAFALGLGPRVVGVSDYVTWPPEATKRPRLGGLFDPSLETVVGLEPDLAILLPSQSEVATRLEHAGIDTLTVGIESVEDVARAARTIGGRCGAEAAGRELAERLHEELAPRPLGRSPRTGRPLRVLLSIDRAPGRTESLLVAGPGTYLDELLTRLGAENVFADAPVRYPQVGMEEILDRAPEVILELRAEPIAPDAGERLLDDWRRYPTLPAVQHDALTLIARSYTMVPGPRLPLLYNRLAQALRRSQEQGATEEAGPGIDQGSGNPPRRAPAAEPRAGAATASGPGEITP